MARDKMLSVTIDPKHDGVLKQAAKRDGRSVAGHLYHLALVDAQSKGLVDENFEPTDQAIPA